MTKSYKWKLWNLLLFHKDGWSETILEAFGHNGWKNKDYKVGMATVQSLFQPQLFPEYFAISVCKAVTGIV